MSGDAVKRALEAACRTDAFYGPGKGPSGYDEGLRMEYAEIIAAFLRALPVGLRGVPGAIVSGYAPAVMPHLLAAAVTQAAQEDSGDGE